MEFDAFVKLISTRKIRVEQERRLRQVWEVAKVSVGCRVHGAVKWEAKALVTKLKAVRESIKDNEQRIKAIAQQFPQYDSLLSIPGFGPVVSAMVLAAIGDPFRFDSRKQILRLAGLDLSAERSGKYSDSAKPVISKQGKSALRYALVQAAKVASSLNDGIRRYFAHMLKGRELERGINLKMKVKLASKLLIVAWTLMKTGEQFKSSCFEL